MNLLKAVVKRPSTIILLVVSVAVFGIYGIANIQMEYFPNLDMPMHVVSVVYPGADADSIESLVTEPIEDVGEKLTGIKTVESSTYENYATITFTYEYGTDIDDVYMELKAEIDNLADDLPEDCNMPQILEISLDSDATITIAAKAKEGTDFNYALDYVNEVVVPEMEKINGVAQVDVQGAADEYLKLVLNEDKMRQYGVSISDIAGVIQNADFSLPVGSVRNGSQDIGVTMDTEILWSSDIMGLRIQTKSGELIYIGDVLSDINLYREDVDSISRFNGQESILIDVTKQTTGETMKVCQEAERIMETLATDGIEFEIVNSAADDIHDTLMEVLKTLLEGVLFSMVVLFVFFGDLRASLIVGSSIPLSMLGGMALLNAMGVSFELMSGTGMIIAIGMLVDNSIVVLENCFRVKEETEDFKETAVKGTAAVLMSIVASTLTTVVVYVPIGMSGGMAGQMNQSLSYTVVFTMVSSLISAATVVPTFFYMFKPIEKKELRINKVLDFLGRGYRKVLPKLLHFPKTTIFASVCLFAVSILIATQLRLDLFPGNYDGSIEIKASFRGGTRLEVMDEEVRQIEDIILEDDNFESVELSLSGSEVLITAYAEEKCDRSSEEAVEYYTDMFKDIAGMDIQVSAKSVATGLSSLMSTGNTVTISIMSEDLDNLEKGAKLVEERLNSVPGLLYVHNEFAQDKMNAKIVIDQQKAMNAGFQPSDVASQIYILLNGLKATDVEYADKEYEVRIQFPDDKYNAMTTLLDQMLVSSNGKMVALGDIAEVRYVNIKQSISRKDGKFLAEVVATTQNKDKYEIAENVKDAAAEVILPDGVEIGKSSIDETLGEEMAGMGSAIVIAIFLVFLVMAIQFNSPKYSLMVMMCLPFSLIGSFGLLFVNGVPLSMMAMMGFLMLIGMVVNNGILLVDTTNSLRQEMPLKEALLEAGLVRLRPILMTTLTTVLSMLPIVFSQDSGMVMMKGMGFVIIGGLCTSTILALFLMPPFYLIMSGSHKSKKTKI